MEISASCSGNTTSSSFFCTSRGGASKSVPWLSSSHSFSPSIRCLKMTASSSLRLLPIKARVNISCQAEGPISTPDGFTPEADFYKIEAVLRPWRLPHVTSGLVRVGIRGVTVSDVRGFGAQGGARERQAGSEFGEESFVSKVKLEVVVSKDQVDAVVNTIIDQARTGEIGDGKIFVLPVADVVRVRTGERGLKGERMIGGRADLLSSSNTN